MRPASLRPVPRLPRLVATARRRTLLAAVSLTLSVAVLALLALLAGWRPSVLPLRHADWSLLVAVFGAHLVGYAAYMTAHRRMLNLREGPALRWRETTTALLAGFGALPMPAGFGVDRAVLHGVGVSREQARISSVALALAEMAVLTPVAWVCALLLLGAHGVPESESMPWAILVPVLAVPVVVAALRAERLTTARWVQETLAAVRRTLELARRPRRGAVVFGGVALYWAGDIAALWAALRLCHVHISLARLILAHATGYLLTRRTLPLAGAGATEALLSIALTWVGVPLHAAVPAVLVYRLSDLALTIPPALAASASVIRLAHPEVAAAMRPDRRSSAA
ncbi:MAG TPA: lysylphosphatidylglycerol synthase domain-containing protein [Solirubrobacteraceae bacterium]|nr:lysylphosphatidylglycerol synthase domain-containing protein [Solirubrobacteraceae bacterium]